MTIKEFLSEVREELGVGRELKLCDTPESVEDWDSVGHLSIIAMIEERLNVPVDNDEMQNFESLKEIVDRLIQLGAISG